MKLGLYGGTFDPIHIAHLIIASKAREQLSLDRMIFMPCAVPPHKLEEGISDSQHRLQMVRLAVAGNPCFEASDLEIRLGGLSYTVNTLDRLSRQYDLGPDQLFLIIGSDSYNEFETWHEPERILSLCRIAVAGRPGDASGSRDHPQPKRIQMLDTPQLEIASSRIRSWARQGRSITYFVPRAVEQYIDQQRLYCR